MPAEPTLGAKVKAEIPVAKPPQAAVPEVEADLEDEDEVEHSFWSVETLKGWASSVFLHALILIAMACWYFAPPSNPPKIIDTRMMGSDLGVEDGLNATGGLSAELEMPQAPQAAPEPSLSSAINSSALDLKPPDLNTKNLTGADKPTGGGGMKSNNPGAGLGDGFGLAKFGSGGENIHGVEVKVGDPQFTLIWDTDADLDLHVIEPGGKEIYWEDPKGAPNLGGELDVDNTKGFGPENIYWLKKDDSGTEAPGTGPAGTYKWFVVYWGGFGGIPKPTHWKVRIKHDGKVTVQTGKFVRSTSAQQGIHRQGRAPRLGPRPEPSRQKNARAPALRQVCRRPRGRS